jgi:PAS domain S-box-containing protein
VAVSTSPIFDAEGEVIGIVTFHRDITERVKAAEYTQRLAMIVEQSKDAIIGTGLPDGNIVSWNPAAERMYGYTAEEVIGRPAYFLTPQDQQAQTHAIADALAAGEYIPDFEALRLRKDGTQVPVAISVSTILDEHGKITGLVTFHRDITTQIEARSAIEEEAAEEKQRLAELEQFQRLTVGRELKMIELKKEIESLKKQRPTGGSDPGDQFET